MSQNVQLWNKTLEATWVPLWELDTQIFHYETQIQSDILRGQIIQIFSEHQAKIDEAFWADFEKKIQECFTKPREQLIRMWLEALSNDLSEIKRLGVNNYTLKLMRSSPISTLWWYTATEPNQYIPYHFIEQHFEPLMTLLKNTSIDTKLKDHSLQTIESAIKKIAELLWQKALIDTDEWYEGVSLMPGFFNTPVLVWFFEGKWGKNLILKRGKDLLLGGFDNAETMAFSY
jgi:hypothetical protein